MTRHRFDPLSFAFGVGFVVIGLAFVVPESPWDVLGLRFPLGWVWPVALMALGGAIVAVTLRSVRSDGAGTGGEPDTSEAGTNDSASL